MKKVLLTLAVMAVAAVTQAVTLYWSASMDYSKWFKDYTCSLVYTKGTEATLETAVSAATSSTEVENYTKFTPNEETTFLEGGESVADGKWTAKTVFEGSDAQKGSGTYFLIFTDSSNKYAGAQFTADDAKNAWGKGTAGSLPTMGNFIMDLTFTGELSVPEPTALALLALGVAGLALRRRA